MHEPSGRHGRSRWQWLALGGLSVFVASFACGSQGGSDGVSAPLDLQRAPAALTLDRSTEAPHAVVFAFDLDGERFELSLERAPAPVTADYRAFRNTREGTLVPLPAPDLGCTYRGVVSGAGAGPVPGFAAMSVCANATGHAAGDAASGVLRAGGRFWQLTPDPADTDASDGIDHLVEPLQRADTPASAREPSRVTTLLRLPESPAPRLEFREGTPEETKYIDLVVVNDAARVADLGGLTQATTLQFVDTMNALLETSGLEPRLRVTLRAQVLFEDGDPYQPQFVDDEVDNNSLLNEFLNWGFQTDLPDHDEHLLLSGLDFVDGVVGFAGLGVACSSNANGFIVQVGGASGGFAVLSAVHELGHTVGMNHDDGSQPNCPNQGFIMAAVGCGNCPGAEEAQFSLCSVAEFQDFLAGPAYSARCADDVPVGAAPSCGDGAVQDGETCDCGSSDCSDIDPCCNGALCQLRDGAECSDFNDGCCQSCTIVPADANVTCRPQRSVCDIAERCLGSRECPADSFEAAGEDCEDDRGNGGACYFGDCRSRGTQCEQIGEQEDRAAFDNFGEPPANCGGSCNQVVCGNGTNACITISNVTVNDGVPCNNDGQCVDQQCVNTIDQCPNDPDKDEPGDCGCGRPDSDRDGDDTADCADLCPADASKQAPGDCGCGNLDSDSDSDDTADCIDQCPNDAAKAAPGDCGCGAPDVDSDRDGAADCIDECPNDAASRRAGACGCGVAEVDTDFDGTADCVDGCRTDASATAPPCAIQGGTDTDGDGDVDIEAASQRGSDDGGCALRAPGSTPAGSAGFAGHVGWLMLAAPLLWRRRSRLNPRAVDARD